MVKTEREHRQDIVDIGRLVYQKGWVAANDGNITIRLDHDRILSTPTGVSKGMMHVDDLIIVDNEGNKLEGRLEKTSEILMHLVIYNMRADVHAIVHAHPPVSTGFAAAGLSLNKALLPEVVIGLGCVPLAEYGLPGTPELSERMRPLIPKFDAILLANHGAVAYGGDIRKAFFRMETVEHFARINLVAQMLGGPKLLSGADVQKLVESRGRYGFASAATAEPGCPIVAEQAAPGHVPADGQERFTVTRDELVELVEEAIRVRENG
jgi:L-fuculose-phosphate aldolase